jgi:hypothetical protein
MTPDLLFAVGTVKLVKPCWRLNSILDQTTLSFVQEYICSLQDVSSERIGNPYRRARGEQLTELR